MPSFVLVVSPFSDLLWSRKTYEKFQWLRFIYLEVVFLFPIATNLHSILNRKDIILPTKVCIVKVMAILVVMYGCESWTIKKAEHQKLMLLNCGAGGDFLKKFYLFILF